MTKQRHFREWIYFLYSASCFRYMFDGHLCFSTKLRSSTKILRRKKLIAYALFFVRIKYKCLTTMWQSSSLCYIPHPSHNLPESLRIWIKEAIRIYTTMQFMMTCTVPPSSTWLLWIKLLFLLEITNSFFSLWITWPFKLYKVFLTQLPIQWQSPAELLIPDVITYAPVSAIL